jgi:anti-sigma factor RsiW
MTPDEESPMTRELSAAIREKAEYYAAPASLAAAVRAALPREEPARKPSSPRRGWLRQAAALSGAAFAGALLTWGAMSLRGGDDALARDLLDAHVQATLGKRLIEVASSDQHTVKPWLSEHLPFSPAVADYSAHGFELRGGRVERVGGRPVAVLVYARRKHIVDAFVWPADAPGGGAASLTRSGFHVESFSAGGMRYALVSDLNRNELRDLAQLLAQDAAR